MKRILAMVVCVAILATVAITGSVAYFTDTDSATNVFTVGNVVIEQHEQKRGEDGLENLTSNDKGQHELGMLHPMVEKSEGESYKDQTFNKTKDDNGTNINLRDLTHWANYVDKIVTVENKGKSDAYVRNIVAIPTGDVNLETVPWLDVDWYDAEKKSNDDWKAPTVKDGTIIKNVDISGVPYDIYVIYYKGTEGKLAPNTTTLPTLLGVGLSKNVDYDKTTQKYYYYGTTTSDTTTKTRTDLNIDPEHMYIYVATQAVQTEGFDNAEEAFKETFGAIDQNHGPWADLGQSYGIVNGEHLNWPDLTAKDENGNSLVSVSTDGKTLTKIDSSISELYISGNDVKVIDYSITDPSKNNNEPFALKKLTIGKGVEEIKNFAFQDAANLTTVELPSTPITIGSLAFWNCTGLTEITIPGNVTFADNSQQFSGCKNLETVIIGEGITDIPYACFYGCNNLKNITFPKNSLKTIGNNAFLGSDGFTEIVLPDSVETIGSGAFSWSDSLQKITIPSKVTKIEEYTFRNCKALKTIIIKNTEGSVSIADNAFEGCPNDRVISYND